MNDYIEFTERMFFKHEISENLPCDTYSMHTHNVCELIYLADGDVTHVIEDRTFKLKKGDLVLIRPFCYHFIRLDSPCRYERYNILFDPDRHHVESAKRLPPDTEVIHLSDNRVAEDIFRRCDLYRRHTDEKTFEEILPHLLSELFYHISIFPHPQSANTSSLSPLISCALKYTNDHLCTLRDVREIADALFVSESYLFRLFKKELHQTPKKYVLEKRLLLAYKMIAEGARPSTVYDRCGFSDYTTFYRNYTAFFGHSPKSTFSAK